MTPRRTVEHRTCRRHGLCLAVAPEAFTVGRDGRIQRTDRTDAVANEGARQAARLCPVQAIRVED